ncbi:unnamed protein product [Cuscuta epithymum]|uniref:Uncharacterized protein n=1 Tax=Cuscuta epithymum TaxID=186058 RepID=A0AAV0G7U0_9ASTE|nr:unnamed protein product [Cuscuta epithymum]
MEASTIASTSSTTAPASATFTDAAVVITSAPVTMTEPQQVTSSQTGSVVHPASSPFIPDVPGAYSLFQTIPSVFPWQPPVVPQIPGSLFSTPVSAAAQQPHSGPGYFGSTFSGAPGLSSPQWPQSLNQSPRPTMLLKLLQSSLRRWKTTSHGVLNFNLS